MASPPYMKLYIADYHVDTTDLDVIGHGAYLLLLMAMFRAGGKLPKDEARLAKIAKCTAKQWASVRDDIMPHFKIVGGSIRHARVTKEIAKYEAVISGAETAGKTSAAKRANKNSAETPTNVGQTSDVSPTNLELKTLKEEPPKAPKGADGEGYPPDFEEAWRAYPHFKGRSSKPKARAAWARLSTEVRSALPAACARYATEGREPKESCGAKAMDLWIRDERFADWMGPATDGPAPDPALIRKAWEMRVSRWKAERLWDEERWGPRPDQPKCQAPADLLPQPADLLTFPERARA